MLVCANPVGPCTSIRAMAAAGEGGGAAGSAVSVQDPHAASSPVSPETARHSAAVVIAPGARRLGRGTAVTMRRFSPRVPVYGNAGLRAAPDLDRWRGGELPDPRCLLPAQPAARQGGADRLDED